MQHPRLPGVLARGDQVRALLDWLRKRRVERDELRRMHLAQSQLRACKTLEEQEQIQCPLCGARLVAWVDEVTGGRGGELRCGGCRKWAFAFDFKEPVKNWQLRLGRFLH
jgi:hypothetical protein